jgi:23S rRNA pseudouridine2605 synthase
VALAREGLAYYALNKPRGIVSTVRDEHGRRTVLDLVPAQERVYPVGRLDAESEGLVLLTNDGDLAQRLTHPRYQVAKVYEALVSGRANEDTLRQIGSGVQLEDGRAQAAEAAILEQQSDATLLRLVMKEGRKHEVRRLLQALGHVVLRLRRTAIGSLGLGPLRSGEWRTLLPAEIAALRSSVDLRKSG